MDATIQFNKRQFADMEQRYRAQFFNSLSGFKSLNLVGTINSEGQTNLSIVNSVIHIGANPPYMGMIIRPDKVERHTLDNLQQTGWYTFNHVLPSFYKQAHQTSARYPRNVSEFDACGLTPYYTETCKAPYVLESKVHIGLKVQEVQHLAINGTVLVIGSVEEVLLPTVAITNDGYVDLELAGSITCSGLDSYHNTKRIARLSYAKEDDEVKEV